jgi:small subunit ribosomal protein S2
LKTKVSAGDEILFVGTKRQAQDIIKEEATRCGMFFVNQRWLGGTLTNFSTIQKSIGRFKEYKRIEESGELGALKKKEIMQIKKEMNKLSENLMGILDMKRLPGALFVVDPKKDEIAVKEAKKLSIPIVSLIDTNGDPDMIDFVVPGNDDAIKAIKFVTSVAADAILEAKRLSVEGKKEEGVQGKKLAVEGIDLKRKAVTVEESAIEDVEEVVEKKIKRPDDFEVKMKKRSPRQQTKEGKK